MENEVRIKITDPSHLMDLGEWVGYATAIERLKKLPASEKSAGFGLAVATLETLEARKRAENAGRNLRLIVKAGHDLDAYHVVWKGADELVLEPVSQQDSATPAPEGK